MKGALASRASRRAISIDAGQADHQDIFRCYLVAQIVVQLHAAPAVAQSNGNSALGGLLTHNVFVQFE